MTTADKSQHADQRLRLRRSLVGLAGSAGFTLLAWVAWHNGLVHLSASAFWLLFGIWLAGIGGFPALILSGRNLALADPAMTVPQILWSALGPILLYPFVPSLAQLCHMGLLAIGLFGAFRLGNQRYFLTNAAMVVGLGIAFVVQQSLWAGVIDRGDSLLGFGGFVLALGIITFVGFELGGVRRTLNARNAELTRATERLEDMAIRDELTGLHNRRFLGDVLAQQRAEAERHHDHRFSLCFIDLDHFKRINDRYGHARGDEVLKQFAGIAKGAVRDVDFVARIGGEEFVLVLVRTSQENACVVAERIRRRLDGMQVSDREPEARLSASFGITEYIRGETIGAAISRADAALYRAKRTGRDRVIVAEKDEVARSETIETPAVDPVGGTA